MQIRVLSRLEDLASRQWDSLSGTENPFLSHAFLSALETRGAVSPENGWQASHLLLETDDGVLLAAMPAYLKAHSWGEFVFDWAWADAYARNGLDYYPKLIVGVPFSPVNGPRLLTASDISPHEASQALQQAMETLCRQRGWSSAHCLFPDKPQAHMLADNGWLLRQSTQFHWRNAGYRDFEHFLAHFNSRKRKNVRRERRLAAAHGLRFEMVPGDRVSQSHWDDFHRHYAETFHAHGNLPLLSRDFFRDIGQRLGDRLLMSQALDGERLVASALFLRSSDTHSGRYWGGD
ncbi:MAG: GNAT family N-acetyltransferase, partial [Ectothiorhodospiraceae bacterium]|nr:GNAT family N-acetyltransferase [Ectothiorhodospiraceae bacterium]